MSDVTDEMVEVAAEAMWDAMPHATRYIKLAARGRELARCMARAALAAVAPMIAAAEREACAQVVQTEMTTFTDPQYAGGPIGAFAELFACKQILNAIRARTGDAT